MTPIMTTTGFFWLFAVLFTLHQVWEIALTLLNSKAMRAHREEIPAYFPESLKDKIDPERYQKSIDYNLEKSRFGLTVRAYDVVVVWAVLLSGVLGRLDIWIGGFGLLPILHSRSLTHHLFD